MDATRQDLTNEMAGHNLPPDMTATAEEVSTDLSGWLSENPVIDNEDVARQAKLWVDRGSLCVQDLEAERITKVKPLNEQVRQINDHYRSPRELLEKMIDELKSRVTSYLRKEEEARFARAEVARLQAENAERIAREAEDRERAAYGEASDGVLGVNLSHVTTEANEKFKEFEKAARIADIAARDAERVKIGGGFRRALSLRNKEEAYVSDPHEAIRAIGWDNEIILEAILKAARAFKRLHGNWPNGITVNTERKS